MMCAEKDKGGGVMERLTKRNEADTAYYYPNCFKECGGLGYSSKCDNCGFRDKVCDKLGEYEDLEDNGLMLRLPCPIGTTVYNTTWWDCVQEKVKVDGKTFYRTVHKHKVSKSTFSLLDICDFGKTVFLTKAEAEQKLKEMESD